MNKYITITISLFVGAALAAVAIFWYLSSTSYAGPNFKVIQDKVNTQFGDAGGGDATEANGTALLSFTIPTGGIALSSLSLSDEQKAALGKVGIDASTFVLTETMLECGVGKIGADRIEAIVGGQAPTFMETTKMLPCLGAE